MMPTLDDAELLRSFSDWLDGRRFSFTSSAESLIDSLSAILRTSGYDKVEERLGGIRTALLAEKAKDFDRYKDRILQRLRAEISARYLSTSEQIRQSLRLDAVASEAALLLGDRNAYARILRPR